MNSRLKNLQFRWRDLMDCMAHARIVGDKEEYYRLDAIINQLELEIQKELPCRKETREK